MSIIRIRENMHHWSKYIMGLLAVIFIIGFVGLAAPGGRLGAMKQSADDNPKIVIINNDSIDRKTFEAEVSRALAQSPKGLSPIQELRKRGEVFEQMVSRMVMTQAAKKEGIRVSNGDVNKAMDGIVDQQYNSYSSKVLGAKVAHPDQVMEKILSKQGMSVRKLKDEIRSSLDPDMVRQQMVIQKLFEKVAGHVDTSDRAVRASFDEAKIAMILISASNRPPAQAEQRVSEVTQKLQGGADFAAVAKQYSDEKSSAAKGGEVPGYIHPSTLGPDMQQAIAALQIGKTSPPIKMGQSFMIIKLEDKKSALPADYNDPNKHRGYVQAYAQQVQSKIVQSYETQTMRTAKIDIKDPELQGYEGLKSVGMGAEARPKLLQVIALFKKAAENAGDNNTAASARAYSAQAYLLESLRKEGDLSKADYAQYGDEEQKAIQAALNSCESSDLHLMLANIYIEKKAYDNAIEQMRIVSDNAYDDYEMHVQLASMYKDMKGNDKASGLLASENKWLADNKDKKKAQEAKMQQEMANQMQRAPAN
jgi:peptidyl-prolyl cis-trans isomerase SurA